MKIKILRGTREIGGSCVEVWTDTTRILIDVGMPLLDKGGGDFDFRKYQNLSVNDLRKRGILPDVNGIYKDDPDLLDGVLISHPHQDHYGLAGLLHPQLKYYIGKAAYHIINTSNLFTGNSQLFDKHTFYEKSVPFRIGNMIITPYWMDHSAFDAYGFLIENDCKKLFYSGDFRGHGRKSGALRHFLANPPKNVDYLLLEGTMIGRWRGQERSEKSLVDDFKIVFEESLISLIMVSGQNIDRLVTIYKACRKANKTLVVDPYIAAMLIEAGKDSGVQRPSENYPLLKVYFTSRITTKMLNSPHSQIIYRLKKQKVTRQEIDSEPGKYAVCIRPSHMPDLRKMKNIDGGNLIFSMWKGYLKKSYNQKFINYLQERRFKLTHIHTSGHADIPTLKAFVNAIDPKHIIPIHTLSGNRYKDVFDLPVVELKDGEIHNL